ncbi:hypothetical protein B0H13DRAFT_2333218 [Mycena leptocephala]|nr:hypothetical protein B0H13DRAFT_2333218 [Mycena leptocephala]
MAATIYQRNIQPRPPGRNIPLKIYKGSLENREDPHGQDLLQVSVVGNVDKNETSGVEEHHLQAALATSTVRIPIPGSIQLVENYAELYPSNRWMDTKTYLESAQTISEACSAALFDHDYTYFMDEADKTWLDNTNYQCRVEEQIAQEPPSAETDEIFIRASISEDEFELVMGLFEILTGPKLQQQLPDFSFFKPFFLAPLRPDTFASHVVPAWIRPPFVLSSIALTIHPHWQQRRSLRGGRKIFPSLNSEENDYINAAYTTDTKTSGPLHDHGPAHDENNSFTIKIFTGHFAFPPTLLECVQGPLRADGTNSTSVIIDPETNPVDMVQTQTSQAATARVEPTHLDIIGDQHHLNSGIFRQKRRRLVHPLEHLI